MKIYSHVKKFIVFISIILLIDACGYRPSSKYAREVLGKRISTDVVISTKDPENTVIIKDAVDSALIEIFHTSITAREYADTHLVIKIRSTSYSPIQYNEDGFVIAYRATTVLGITRQSSNVKKHYITRGTYDFSVTPNAVLTDQERFEAIKNSSAKAISSFVARISAEGTMVK